MRTIIIGGVAAGMSAATRLRRLDEQREIVVFERGAHVSFANCGLPYYVGGVIADRSSLLLQTPASLAARFALRVHVRHEVAAIDAASKVVRVRDLDAGTERDEPFDDPHWFWSDQYDADIQMAGFAFTWDEIVFRGNMEERTFAAFLLKDGQLLSTFAMNRPKDVRRSMKLIKARAHPTRAQLEDPDVDLRTLVPKGSA